MDKPGGLKEGSVKVKRDARCVGSRYRPHTRVGLQRQPTTGWVREKLSLAAPGNFLAHAGTLVSPVETKGPCSRWGEGGSSNLVNDLPVVRELACEAQIG